jgi:DNA-directed RNA polymerase subunit RPC12/RpoP
MAEETKYSCDDCGREINHPGLCDTCWDDRKTSYEHSFDNSGDE